MSAQVNPPGGTGDDGSLGIVVMGTGQDDKMRVLCYDKAKSQVMLIQVLCKDGRASVPTGFVLK